MKELVWKTKPFLNKSAEIKMHSGNNTTSSRNSTLLFCFKAGLLQLFCEI